MPACSLLFVQSRIVAWIIECEETHPLRRGGTDFMSLQGRLWSVFDIVIRQTESTGIGIASHSLPEAILLRISFN
jgi:hypothetical protein